MCKIAGFYHPHRNYLKEEARYRDILKDMSRALVHKGTEASGVFLAEHAGLSQTGCFDSGRKGSRPMTKRDGGLDFAIAFHGELYNAKELKALLALSGYSLTTVSDAEVVLTGLIEFGPDFAARLNGVFAFAYHDPVNERLLLFRDRVGVKPLFYVKQEEELIFASELKGLFPYPGVKPSIGRDGLNQVFSIGPARTPGCGVFTGMKEVLPGHFLSCSPEGISAHCYWKLVSRPHEDSYEKTVEKTAFLVQDSIRRQIVSDVPICTFLSGGVDSSLVSAVCAEELKKQGKILDTYSFDFTGNDINFKANVFQPSLDRPYVDQMAAFLGSRHTYLECSNSDQAGRLYDSVLAHDLPAMGDIDSSMLHFCSLVSSKVALTGECADEIFGGYPWFHKEECLNAHTFPWTMDLDARKALLKDEFIDYLQMDSYVQETYERSVSKTPALTGEAPEEARRREISYLNLCWFMQTLLNRMERAGMYSGLSARVPFADYRIIEYLWNVPWEMKARDGVVKSLLRQAGKGLIPDEILFRKKSPYPKTYDKNYEKLLATRVREIAGRSDAPIMKYLDQGKLEAFLKNPSDYGKPWYGQLMAGPQMLAYVLQINFWLETYRL